jgi:multidrug efflux pump
LGNATGFDRVTCRTSAGIGHEKLMEARDQFLGLAAQSKVPCYQRVRPNGLNDQPQYHAGNRR